MPAILPLPRRSRQVPAVAVSALLHLAALWLLRHYWPQAGRAAPPLTVRVQPIVPGAPPARPPAAEATPKRPAPASRAAAHSVRPPESAPRRARRPGGDASARPAQPGLTLEGLRQQARALDSPAAEAKPLAADPAKAKLARQIDQAEKADCAKAYANMGLLAIPFLLKGTLDQDNGCKW